MQKINYTAHVINVYTPDGKEQIEAIEPSGMMVRILNDRESVEIDGVRFSVLTSKKLVLLTRDDFFKKNKDALYIPIYHEFPAPLDDTFYIVSSMVQDASERTDLLSPDTDNPVLDKDGKIIGCTGYIVKNFDFYVEKRKPYVPFCSLPEHVIEAMGDVFEKPEQQHKFLTSDVYYIEDN